ncbi:MAG: Protein kinase domain protein [Labilithrix sp.]|nr:Protein kinase domain protein [Labilithrix sp.]
MTKHQRPAWLIAAIAGFSVSALSLAGAAGCARSLYQSPVGQRVFGTTSLTSAKATLEASPSPGSVQLTSSSVARLNFASADIPVEQLLRVGDRPLAMNGLCPPDMASIDDKFCVDKYEASLVEIMPNGDERAWPYYQPVDGHTVRAVSEKGVYPQGYISEKQAIEACGRSGKRLCKPAEWKTACKGPEPKKFGYANERTPGTCNDNGKSPVGTFFPAAVAEGKAWTWDKMNDERLNQMSGGLAETGSHEGCTNGYGVYDMVGNLHEWVLDSAGTFQGGYYLDVTQNGDGCGYRTDAHEAWYHDYSTGFRCCADPAQ